MESHLKLDEQARIKIADRLSSDAIKLFIDNVKAAPHSDTGDFEMTITTDDVDRMGEVVSLDGWDLSHYMKSPVVLWGHNYGLMPVGITDSLTREGNKIIAKGRFAPTEFGQTLRRLYDAGMLKASSVGFMVLEQDGNTITKAQLLEWSFVSVPANPYALSLRELYNIQSEEVAGLVVKSVSEQFQARIKEGEPVVTPPVETPVEVPVETPIDAPEAATPSTEAASDLPDGQKGEVQDALTEEQKYEAKAANMRGVWDILYALCDVYFKKETPVEDFGKLLGETISILNKLNGGTDDTQTGEVYTAISSVNDEVKSKRYIALENILGTKTEDGSADNSSEGNDEGGDDEETVEVLEKRKLLQDVQTIIQKTLTEINPKLKTLY